MEYFPSNSSKGNMEGKKSYNFTNEEMAIPSFLNKIEASIIKVTHKKLRSTIKEEGTFLD